MVNLANPMFVLRLAAWTMPELIAVFWAGKTHTTVMRVLLRVVYLPYLVLLTFALVWFWAGDGELNLWLVPLLFLGLSVISVRVFSKRWLTTLRTFDQMMFLMLSSTCFTVVLILLIHGVLHKPLIIE